MVTVNPSEPRAERLAPALEHLRAGGVVALPTETFYGLAVDPFDPAAVGRVNAIKGKPSSSPCLLLMSEAAQVERVASRLPASFEELARRHWPGPLTLVVPARDEVPDATTGGRGTVAVRVPGLALPRRVAEAFGGPVTGVSANRTGMPPCRRAAEVAERLHEVELILDGGPTAGGAPSTIVDLTGERPVVIRAGLLPLDSLRPFLPGLQTR